MTTKWATEMITANANDDISARRTLKTGLWITEGAVIAITAWSGFNLATGHGGSAAMAAPLLLIAAIETMRVPLAGWSTRVGTAGRIGAALALGAIGLMSFEGLSLAFEQFVNNRVVTVSHLQHDVEKAQHSLDRIVATRTTADGDISELTAEVRALDDAITQLSKDKPSPPSLSKTNCGGGRDKHNKPNPTYSCGADVGAAKGYQAQVDAYNERLNGLLNARKSKQGMIDTAHGKATSIDETPAMDAVANAKQALSEELMLSPMHRLAASIYRVPVSEVTERQFNTVKNFAVFGLAGAISVITMLVSLVAHAEAKREKKPGRVANAIRAWIARKRKPLKIVRVVEVPGPETIVEKRVDVPGPTRDRVVFRYVPYSLETGLQIKPDGSPGERVPLHAVAAE